MTKGVHTVAETNRRFPPPLRDSNLIPPCYQFFAIGSLEILNQELIGFFCSKKCPGEVILNIYDLARTLRDAKIPMIGGFHSSMEKECLDLLLRGKQPIVICPARSIQKMRIPSAWKKGIEENRLLILSPFEQQHRRPTVALAENRNRFVAKLATSIFIAHASEGGKTEQFCSELKTLKKRLYTIDCNSNTNLLKLGAESIEQFVNSCKKY